MSVWIFLVGFADLLPVVAEGVWVKWLIISVFMGILLVVCNCRFVAGCRFFCLNH